MGQNPRHKSKSQKPDLFLQKKVRCARMRSPLVQLATPKAANGFFAKDMRELKSATQQQSRALKII